MAPEPPRAPRSPSLPDSLLTLVPLSDAALVQPAPPWHEPAPPMEWRYRVKIGVCALLILMVPVAVIYFSARAMRKASGE